MPASPGVYLWWFRDTLGVPVDGCLATSGLVLLYAGISPKAPPANGARASSQGLRSRIRYHYRGNAEGSTLRLTLGCLLGLELRRVGSGTRRTFSARELELDQWMQENAFVSWIETSEPWLLEAELISTLSLPLNLDQNQRHPFHLTLQETRARAKQHALMLDVLPR